ncbi:MAG: metal-sensing transcriptional repressor [Patescibacteria group bacterium]|jgi:DNA-binding FrmR family transcriptional regulator
MHYQTIFNRLRRIEGQIRGIEDMLDKNKPEKEILIQLEAAKSSLASTISTFVELLIIKNRDEDGNVVLGEDEITIINRFIKK